ncbi:hypothetical protein K2X30_11740 [bacterium]|nr:hypothetical protein [bacterium]
MKAAFTNPTQNQPSGQWIPLMEYATKKGVSLSTLRRYIKSDKVQYRVENGRYLLLDPDASNSIEEQLRKAHEEIAELKMLIALYEEKIPSPRMDV